MEKLSGGFIAVLAAGALGSVPILGWGPVLTVAVAITAAAAVAEIVK